MTNADMDRLIRVFGSLEAYRASLPERHMVRGEGGLVTHERGRCEDCMPPTTEAGVPA